MRVYLETFGCQMNELDSELVHGQLSSLGYQFVDRPEDAQVVLYNTCSVREQAEQKAYSRIGIVGQRKKAGERLILGVIGCMAERDGVDMMRRHPQVDLLCGPAELDRLPQLIDNARTAIEAAARDDAESARTLASPRTSRVALAGNKTRRTATLAAAEDNLEALDLSRSFQLSGEHARRRSAYVRITRGCNKFCTYCVVPHTRGAEVHRPPNHIVDECKRLVDAGAIEITLLGQTVNHYRYTHGTSLSVQGHELAQVGPGLSAFRAVAGSSVSDQDPAAHTASTSPPAVSGTHHAGSHTRVTTFANLLARIHDEVPGLQRLRFVTSYPRDFGPDILSVMRDCPRICRYLHAPAQSGSDRILKLMNRGYSVGEYLEFVDQALEYLPDAGIAGDIIVGFPTETDEDFQATVDLVRRVPFKNNFIFKYSPRPGTTAIERYPDDVPDAVTRARNNALLAVQSEVSAKVHASWVGRSVPVLFDDVRVLSAAKTAPQPPRVELGWERNGAGSAVGGHEPATTVQAIGRTPQDLIVAIDCRSESDANQLLGGIRQVQIKASMPLLLRGSLAVSDR